MREIKFRAWDKPNKRMLFFSEPAWDDESFSLYFMKGELDVPVGDNMILMQYTGLKDKNDKEIYEGDIVMLYCSKNHPVMATIKWLENGYVGFSPLIHDKEMLVTAGSMKGKMINMGEVHSWCGMHYCFSKDMEVIGNVYENPELLKEDSNGQG